MKQFFNEKVLPGIMKFINTKGVQSIKNGMVYSMPLLIVGSIFLILSNFPVKAVTDALEASGIKVILDQAYGATFNISAMIAVIGISYTYVKLEGQEPLSGAMIALSTFLLFMPSSITTESGEVVGGIINKTWTAGQGMIGAIIMGLVVPAIYCWFLKKKIRIKMPAGVPEGVANSFSALLPAMAIITVGIISQNSGCGRKCSARLSCAPTSTLTASTSWASPRVLTAVSVSPLSMPTISAVQAPLQAVNPSLTLPPKTSTIHISISPPANSTPPMAVPS